MAGIEGRPESVWLARPEALAKDRRAEESASESIGKSVIVQSSRDVWRVTKVPDHPVLGRGAREKKIESLEGELAKIRPAAQLLDERRKKIDTELSALGDLGLKLNDIENGCKTLADLGIDDASETAIEAARTHFVESQRERRKANELFRRLDQNLVSLKTQLDQYCRNRTQAQKTLEHLRANGEPIQRRWEQLLAEAEDLLVVPFSPEVAQGTAGRGSIHLYSEALSSARVLHERLSQAEPDGEIGNKIDEICRLDERSRSGEDYLRAWREVRAWLQRRIPAQIAQMDDPLEALKRLRRQLADLQSRLVQQEGALQGNSADVANAIGTNIRQARRDIDKLNKDLAQVQFGSVAGVRLHLGRVPEMANILEALREGDDQGRLFAADRPLEEALNDLLEKYASGRAQGERLLDYREYVDPRVEVQRKSSPKWEIANPNRLSTGESIGIGAALMMVVLTAWEHSARLLRSKSAQSTLRLLLLDEANRLDRDNLGVLFDLCSNLDLQLLVAAPEVAQAEGNTTYRLVRVPDGNQGEEVRVTGRRMVAEEAA